MPFPMPSPGNPVVPMPINGRRNVLPGNTLTEHLADVSDPHNVKALVPAMRTGTGAPSVLTTDKATDLYFDTSSATLYVMKSASGAKQWVAVTSANVQTPAAATTLATQISALSHTDLTEFEKDVLIQKLADYVVAKESLS